MLTPRRWSLDRDRTILLSGSAAIAGVAWWYLIRMAGRMPASGHVHSHGSHLQPGLDTAALFAMWTVMMVAMMLPSSLPFVLMFSAEQARRRTKQMTVAPASFFVAGYFVMWTVFSGVCALLQQALHGMSLLSPAMSATSSAFSGALLVAAGGYQWTPMKYACLRHCRSPLTFLLSDWREGAAGAFRMGAGHGLFCIGCCWMLMLLPFAAGVMNLLWMAGITVLLLLEKAAPGGEWMARACGGVLVFLGACVIIFRIVL
jgi:predicted metal-binding membrane protein